MLPVSAFFSLVGRFDCVSTFGGLGNRKGKIITSLLDLAIFGRVRGIRDREPLIDHVSENLVAISGPNAMRSFRGVRSRTCPAPGSRARGEIEVRCDAFMRFARGRPSVAGTIEVVETFAQQRRTAHGAERGYVCRRSVAAGRVLIAKCCHGGRPASVRSQTWSPESSITRIRER